jgi:hypothetical protein
LNIFHSLFTTLSCKGGAKLKGTACRLHDDRDGEAKMSSPKTPPTIEEFRARAALTGLTLTPEDIEHLHKGYVGLLSLMERIPSNWAWAAEPPHVFRADK